MSAPTLLTYRDMIEHLVGYVDGLGQEAEQNRARQAVQAAYRELGLEHSWHYLSKHDRISVSAQYTTGTVAYTSSTRTLTGSGTTFPTWARYGRLLFSGDTVLYKIAERTDGTTLTLESAFAPAADVAAGTSYTLYRSVYPLPGDFWRLEEVHDETVWGNGFVVPSEWVRLERQVARAGRPFVWTIMGHPDLFGSMALCFYGRIASAQTFDFIYQTQPRRLKYDGYNFYSSQDANTLDAYSVGDTSIDFSGVSLETDVVDAVLRTAMSAATGPPGGIGAAERYAEQKIITVRDDADTVTVDSGMAFASASTEFTISDPVDLPEYMLDAFERGCEYQMAIRQQEVKDRMVAQQAYERALVKAKARNNSMVPSPPSPLEWQGFRNPAWAFLTGTITNTS